MSGGTAGRFFRSAGAATFSQVWRVGVTFGVTLLLRRLIPRGDWGLWDWALVVFLILGALRDLGLVYHVVRLPKRPYGNLLLVETVWGGALAAGAAFAAPLIARAFKDTHPWDVEILRALCLFLFFEGLASVPRVFFENELRIGRTVVPEIVRNLVFAVTAVALALLGYGIWSLLVAQVGCTAVYAAHLWLRALPEIPLRFERGNTLRLLADSVPLALIWFLVILTRHVDPLILGAQFLKETVASYTFAYFVAFLVTTTLVPAVTRALYPALVAFAAEPKRLVEAYRLATLFVLALEAPVALFLFVNADTAIRIVGGGQWSEAPTFLRLLCFAPLVDPFSRLGGEMLKVYHRDRIWIVASATTLVSFLGFGVGFTLWLGPIGMAWANFLPLGGLVMAWAVRGVAAEGFAALCRDIAVVYLAPLPPLAAAYLLFPGDPTLRFVASLGAVAIAFGFYAVRFGPSFRAFFRDPVAAAAGEELP